MNPPITVRLLPEGPTAAAATVAPAVAAAAAVLSCAGGTCSCAAGAGCCWPFRGASGLRLRKGSLPRLKCSSTAADTLPPAGPDNRGMQMPPCRNKLDLAALNYFGLHQYTRSLACIRRQTQRAVQAACLPWTAAASPACRCAIQYTAGH